MENLKGKVRYDLHVDLNLRDAKMRSSRLGGYHLNFTLPRHLPFFLFTAFHRLLCNPTPPVLHLQSMTSSCAAVLTSNTISSSREMCRGNPERLGMSEGRQWPSLDSSLVCGSWVLLDGFFTFLAFFLSRFMHLWILDRGDSRSRLSGFDATCWSCLCMVRRKSRVGQCMRLIWKGYFAAPTFVTFHWN